MKRIERIIDGRHFTAIEDDEGSGTIKYGLAEAGELGIWFRRSFGYWIWLRDGVNTTVDREQVCNGELIGNWEDEGWVPAEAWDLLAELLKYHG